MDSLSPPQIQTCVGSSTSVRFCLQQPKQSEEPCASLLQAPSPRYGLWSLPHHQARRTTSGSRVVRRSRAFDSRELFSMTLEPCEVGFQAPPAAGCGGHEKPSGAERIPPRLASMINGNFGYDHRAPQICSLRIMMRVSMSASGPLSLLSSTRHVDLSTYILEWRFAAIATRGGLL